MESPPERDCRVALPAGSSADEFGSGTECDTQDGPAWHAIGNVVQETQHDGFADGA